MAHEKLFQCDWLKTRMDKRSPEGRSEEWRKQWLSGQMVKAGDVLAHYRLQETDRLIMSGMKRKAGD